MNGRQASWRRTAAGVLAALLVALLPADAAADTAILRNECPWPVILQATHVHRGMLRRDQALLRPGEAMRVSLEADKLVVVTDSKTGRVLLRDALKASRTPVQVGLVVDRATGRVRLLPRHTAP